MSHVNTEARLLAAIAASTNLDEQGRLMARLEEHRAAVRSQREADREIDFASPIVEAAFTPVRTFERHSHETDWLAQTAAGTASDEREAVRIATAEARIWSEGLIDAVKADRFEFREQAKGKAMQVAASFGPHREAAIEAFLRTAGATRVATDEGYEDYHVVFETPAGNDVEYDVKAPNNNEAYWIAMEMAVDDGENVDDFEIKSISRSASRKTAGEMVDEADYGGYAIEVQTPLDPDMDGEGYYAVVKEVDAQGYGNEVWQSDLVEYPEDAMEEAEAWIDSKTASRRRRANARDTMGQHSYPYANTSTPDIGEAFEEEAPMTESPQPKEIVEGRRRTATADDITIKRITMADVEANGGYYPTPCLRYDTRKESWQIVHGPMGGEWLGRGSEEQAIAEIIRRVKDNRAKGNIPTEPYTLHVLNEGVTAKKKTTDREARLRHLLAADDVEQRPEMPSDDLVPGTMPSDNPDGPTGEGEQSGHAQSGEGESPHVDPLDDNRGNRPAFPEQFDGGEETTVNEVTSRRRRQAGGNTEKWEPFSFYVVDAETYKTKAGPFDTAEEAAAQADPSTDAVIYHLEAGYSSRQSTRKQAGTEVEVYDQTKRTCDICQSKDAEFDGKTVMGPWANMCNTCFGQYGVGLGTGRGQKLIYVNASRRRAQRRTAGHWKVKVELEDGSTKTVKVDLPEDAPIVDVDDEAWEAVDGVVGTISHEYVESKEGRRSRPTRARRGTDRRRAPQRRQAMPAQDGWVQRIKDALPDYDLDVVNVASYGGHLTYALEDGYDNPAAYLSVGPDTYGVEWGDGTEFTTTGNFDAAVAALRTILAESGVRQASRRQRRAYATQECPNCGKTNAASADRCGKGGSGGCGAVLPTDEKWASRRKQANLALSWTDGDIYPQEKRATYTDADGTMWHLTTYWQDPEVYVGGGWYASVESGNYRGQSGFAVIPEVEITDQPSQEAAMSAAESALIGLTNEALQPALAGRRRRGRR